MYLEKARGNSASNIVEGEALSVIQLTNTSKGTRQALILI